MKKENSNYTVYAHINKINDKIYIGITQQNVKRRWKKGKGYERQVVFRKAIEKYGWDNFEHIILKKNLTKYEAEKLEIELISLYDSTVKGWGYNISLGGSSNGKHSPETKLKISNSNKIPIICDNNIFKSVKECSKYYGVSEQCMRNWIGGYVPMPNEFYDKGLKYKDSNKQYIIQNKQVSSNHKKKRKIICDNIIYDSVKEFAEEHGLKRTQVSNWLNGYCKMPLKYQILGLQYYEELDTNINQIGTLVFCNNIVYNTIKQCSKYYNIDFWIIRNWLSGRNPMPQKFIDLGLRYATEEDIDTYPLYEETENNM